FPFNSAPFGSCAFGERLVWCGQLAYYTCKITIRKFMFSAVPQHIAQGSRTLHSGMLRLHTEWNPVSGSQTTCFREPLHPFRGLAQVTARSVTQKADFRFAAALRTLCVPPDLIPWPRRPILTCCTVPR